MKNLSIVSTISAIAADIDLACGPASEAAVLPRRRSSRLMLALARNCGLAIVISLFFAAAHGPADPLLGTKHLTVMAQHADAPDQTAGSLLPANQ